MATQIHGVAPLVFQRSIIARFACMTVLLVLLLILYDESWRSMRHVWDTPTYAHGYVVPLIAVWIAWQRREALREATPVTGWTALGVMALPGLLWLAGELAGVDAARHFAVVAMAVLAVPLLFGWQVAKLLTFPLGFLFFAVPFGDFLLPWMMEATAAVTMFLIRLCGVPVYREGMSFVLPSGSWEIIEECSGQRYLIAALPLACLFSWLSFHRNRTRGAFILFTVAVALAANWLRAWGIVMLGHLSDMKIAAGVDHLIYGWGFFGFVMGAVFWLGSRWNENPLPNDAEKEEVQAELTSCAKINEPIGSAKVRPAAYALCASAVLLAVWPWLSSELLSHQPHPFNLADEVRRLSAYTRINPLDPTEASFNPTYRGAHQEVRLVRRLPSSNLVSVWIGSYESQRERGEMIQHINSIRSGAAKDRSFVDEQMPPLLHDKDVREYLLQGSTGSLMIWQGYFVDGKSTASEPAAKLLTAWRIARGRGDRSIAVVLWTNLDNDQQQTRTRLANALADLTPVLKEKGSRP